VKIPAPLAAAILAGGCSFTLEPAKRHAKVHIERGGRSRFITISASASDHRAVKNMVGDARRVMRELGA